MRAGPLDGDASALCCLWGAPTKRKEAPFHLASGSLAPKETMVGFRGLPNKSWEPRLGSGVAVLMQGELGRSW
jgi:hypothetical protein